MDDFYAITSQRSREYLRALPFRKKKPFSQLFPEANSKVRKSPGSQFVLEYRPFELPKLQAIDFLERCLTFSPKKRIDVAEALAHPYLEVGALPLVTILFLIRFQAYHDPEDEPTAEPIDPSFFDFDSAVPLSKERLKGARANQFQKNPIVTNIQSV